MTKNIFYNAKFNYGREDGESKFVWGIAGNLNLSMPLKDQILASYEKFDLGLVYNFQITAFNNITIDEE